METLQVVVSLIFVLPLAGACTRKNDHVHNWEQRRCFELLPHKTSCQLFTLNWHLWHFQEWLANLQISVSEVATIVHIGRQNTTLQVWDCWKAFHPQLRVMSVTHHRSGQFKGWRFLDVNEDFPNALPYEQSLGVDSGMSRCFYLHPCLLWVSLFEAVWQWTLVNVAHLAEVFRFHTFVHTPSGIIVPVNSCQDASASLRSCSLLRWWDSPARSLQNRIIPAVHCSFIGKPWKTKITQHSLIKTGSLNILKHSRSCLWHFYMAYMQIMIDHVPFPVSLKSSPSAEFWSQGELSEP